MPCFLVVSMLVQACLSTCCTAPGTSGHRGFHITSYVTYELCYLRFLVRKRTYVFTKGCRFMTLFIEPTLDCCRTAVPVVLLLTLTNHGAGLM